MLRKLLVFLLLTGIPASLYPDAEVPVSGKRGAGIAEVIRLHCRPARLATPGELSFVMTDCFEGARIEISSGQLPAGYVSSGLVVPEWWSEADIYGDTVMRDLANFYPASVDVSRYKADFPPGDVATLRYESPLWWAGTGLIGDVEAELYSPPEALRGRIARAFFYMAVVYPQGILRPKAYTMFTGTPYPALTSYARSLLLTWHRDYPPSDEELEVNERMRRLQGNFNPFISNPGLAEYLWGDKMGEVYAEQDSPVPLHSTYGPIDTIWLTVLGLPEDAVWSIDGKKVTSPSIPASSLRTGDHNLIYTSSSTGETGYVKITITKE